MGRAQPRAQNSSLPWPLVGPGLLLLQASVLHQQPPESCVLNSPEGMRDSVASTCVGRSQNKVGSKAKYGLMGKEDLDWGRFPNRPHSTVIAP